MTDDSLPGGDDVTAPAPRPSKPRLPWLFLFVLLLGVAGFGYWWWTREVVSSVATPMAAVSSPEVDSLRARLDDAAQVNRALRQQVLGLTQRLGVIEDSLGNVERGDAQGIDKQRVVEADFLMHLAEQRLMLFGDISGALSALRLADAQLKESADVRVATARQTLQLEIEMLAAIVAIDLPPLLARLQVLSEQAATWPLASGKQLHSKQGNAWYQNALASLDRYFRVRRLEAGDTSDLWVRDRIALDLSAARWLLLRGEGVSAKALLAGVRATMAERLDQRDSSVNQASAALDEIIGAPFAPELPTLGEARRELARMGRRESVDGPTAAPQDVAQDVTDTLPKADLPEAAEDVAPPTQLPAEEQERGPSGAAEVH